MADLMKDTYTYSLLEKIYGNFVVPAMKLEISGIDIVSAVKVKVTNVDVALSIDTAASASFSICDVFDLKSRKIDSRVTGLLKLGNIVSVSLGYGSATKNVFYGYIAEITTEYSDSTGINVVAMDIVSLMMKRKRENYVYESQNYSDLLNTIIKDYGKCYKSLEIDKTNDSLKKPPAQKDTDFEYIRKVICRQTNKQFLVFAGVIYLRDFDDVTKSIVELKWGESLLSFTDRKKYVNEKYTVIGMEDGSKEKIVASASAVADSISAIMRSKPIEIQDSDSKIQDLEHAQAKAKKFAADSLRKSKSGSGKVTGLPEIVPGRYITISNIGSSSGTFYISSVRHTFSESGFVTEFELGS